MGAVFRGETLIVPTGNSVVHKGDLLYVACERGALRKVLAFFGCEGRPPENVLIIGGGNIGSRLAKKLELRNMHIRLLERDRRRCHALSELLDKTVVIHGDGTVQEILREENIAHMDVVFSLTGDEETNILCSLLARRMGAQRIITRISKFAYMPIARSVGLGHIVNPRLSAINSILQYVRHGKIVSAVSLRGEEAEVLEVEAVDRSELVGRPLREVNFPKGVLVLAVLRGSETIIPDGETGIRPRDRVVILSDRKAIPQVERRLAVKVRKGSL